MSCRIYFFGCWNGPGHFWFKPGGGHVRRELDGNPFYWWIDTGFAPRRFKAGCFMRRALVVDPTCCFAMEGKTDDDRRSIFYDTDEFEQGRALLHVRDGWTLLSWWDRAQGDTRGACNSNFLVEGVFAGEAMYRGLLEHFPHVVENLRNKGITLQPAARSA